MPTWILLRHGESVANAGNWLAGHVDTPLTERGRAQADAAGLALADLPLVRAISSDLSRAVETAERVLATWARARGQAPPALRQVPALRERHTGDWAGRDRAELRASGLMQHLTSWSLGPPGGESQQALARRVIPALAALEAEAVDGPTLVVAHGGVLRVTLAVLDGTPREQVGFFGLPNAEPIIRQVSTGTFAQLARALADEVV